MLDMILGLHIAAGSVALLSMWLPMLARKGAAVHRRAGWSFVAAMATVSVTAVILAVARLTSDPTAAGREGGYFLLVVALLTGASVSSGVRAIRLRGRGGHGWWDLGLAGLLVAASLGLLALAAATQAVLFGGFAVIGLVSGGSQLRYWLRPPDTPMHWWFAHMSGMLGSCIAATTAFLVVNAERWGLGSAALVLWLAPTLVGTPAIAIWSAYYRRRFSRPTATPAAGGAVPLPYVQ